MLVSSNGPTNQHTATWLVQQSCQTRQYRPSHCSKYRSIQLSNISTQTSIIFAASQQHRRTQYRIVQAHNIADNAASRSFNAHNITLAWLAGS
jgi:hypothetical protein